MRASDIIKIANTQRFDIYKLNQSDDNNFILKHLVGEESPSWDILSENKTYVQTMRLYHELKSQTRYPLLYWKEFSTFDILALINCRFRVWRESNDSKFIIQEFDKRQLKWIHYKEFNTLQERTLFLNTELIDTRTIVID